MQSQETRAELTLNILIIKFYYLVLQLHHTHLIFFQFLQMDILMGRRSLVKKTAEIIRTAVGDRLQWDVMQEFRIFAVTEQPFLERLLGKIFVVILRDVTKVLGLVR